MSLLILDLAVTVAAPSAHRSDDILSEDDFLIVLALPGLPVRAEAGVERGDLAAEVAEGVVGVRHRDAPIGRRSTRRRVRRGSGGALHRGYHAGASVERVFYGRGMRERRRLTRPEVEILRRSVGAVGSLPPDELRRLLDEAALLLEEREKLVALVSELSPPWRDVRGALNQIHHVLGQDIRR